MHLHDIEMIGIPNFLENKPVGIPYSMSVCKESCIFHPFIINCTSTLHFSVSCKTWTFLNYNKYFNHVDKKSKLFFSSVLSIENGIKSKMYEETIKMYN